MSTPVQVANDTHYVPSEVARKGCPCQMTPTYRSTSNEGEESVHEFATMLLTHQTDGETVNSLPLGSLHHQLELGMLDPELLQVGESLFDEKVMNACIKKSGQYLSKVAVNLFEGYAEKDVYPLFCLAKYLREEKGLFIFD